MFQILHPNRWFFYFLAIAASVLLVVYWSAQLFVIEQDITVNQDAATQVVNKTKNDTADTSTWKTYRNEKYGFELALDKDYEGYTAREGTEGDDHFITFTVDTKGTGWYPDEKFSVFAVNIYPLDWWNKNVDAETGFLKGTTEIEGPGGYLGRYMGHNSKFSFAGTGLNQDCPSLNRNHDSVWCRLDQNIEKTLLTAKFFEPNGQQ
jgi:hypothetical protein